MFYKIQKLQRIFFILFPILRIQYNNIKPKGDDKIDKAFSTHFRTIELFHYPQHSMHYHIKTVILTLNKLEIWGCLAKQQWDLWLFATPHVKKKIKLENLVSTLNQILELLDSHSPMIPKK